MRPLELMGVAEIAELFGVSTQRVDQLARQPGFPRPVAEPQGWADLAAAGRRGMGQKERPAAWLTHAGTRELMGPSPIRWR